LSKEIIEKSLFVFILLWFIIAYFIRFYRLSRITKPAKLLSISFTQFIVFDLAVISYFKLINNQISNDVLIYALLIFNLLVLFLKLLTYIFFKFYRAAQKNLRNYVIIGYNPQTKEFNDLLTKRKDYGYAFKGFFSKKENLETHPLSSLKNFVEENNIDVIFCSLNQNSDEDIKMILEIANDNFISVKFIPDNKEVLKQKHSFEYYDYYPVLSIMKSPLDKPENRLLKRIFDILFSLLVIVFIFSWLYPLLWILIKLESKGPALFIQRRNGINYNEFKCYKFRSMYVNDEADLKQVAKNDSRITRVGSILRKTSIDELPQFFNVLLGEMSIVGPRPHMIHENEKFRKKVHQFMGRHYIKPGITGLAQVKGYRGEVITDKDIKYRVKYDLFYIENWSFWLDIKIIILTIINSIKGDPKAY